MSVYYQGSTLDFIKRMFETFTVDNTFLYYYVFLISIIVLLFIGGRYYSSVFVYPSILFLFIVFNPISIWLLDSIKFISSGRFYRFLWIPPVVSGIAFTLTYIIYKLNKNVRQIMVILCITMLVIVGNPSRTIASFHVTENIYNIPQYIIDVAECIRQDYGEGNPVLYYENEFLYYYRTYDPAVISYRDGEIINREYSDEEAKEFIRAGSLKGTLELVILQNKKSILQNDVLEKYLSEIDYIVCKQRVDNVTFYKDLGFKYLGIFDKYEVYRNTKNTDGD